MDKQQLQLLQLLPSLGIDLNPTSSLTSLVKLINESEGPGIQQDQFDRSMQFQQQQAQEENRYKGGLLDLYERNAKSDEMRQQQQPMFSLLNTFLSGQSALGQVNPAPFARMAELLGLPSGMFGLGGPQGNMNLGAPGNEAGISDEAYMNALRARGWAQ